jgi:hypothetical protein
MGRYDVKADVVADGQALAGAPSQAWHAPCSAAGTGGLALETARGSTSRLRSMSSRQYLTART